MRKPIIAANWKMFKTIAEAREFVAQFLPLVADVSEVDLVLCPPFTALAAVGEGIQGSNVRLGAQDVFWKEQGAYTGEVSPLMLKDVGCDYVIVGHSERRGRFGKAEFAAELATVFGDNDATVNVKARAALVHGLTPIICVGETIGERRAGNTDRVVCEQVKAALHGLAGTPASGLAGTPASGLAGTPASGLAGTPASGLAGTPAPGLAGTPAPTVVFAYEPVWAIGTGEVCDAAEANRVIALIRQTIRELLGAEAAAAMRVQYGGSVKPDNIAELIAQPDIDGALVGGASLEAQSFAAIVKACRGK